MDSATHHAQYLDTIDRRREVSDEFNSLDDQRSAIRRRQRDLPINSEEYKQLDAQIVTIDNELAKLKVTKNELSEERDRLALIKAEGFTYVRPASFVNRFLPAVPKGTKEVDRTVLQLSLPSTYWQPTYQEAVSHLNRLIVTRTLLQLAFVALLVLLVAVLLPGALPILAVSATVRITLASILILGTGVMLGVQAMRHSNLGYSAIATTSRYTLGAEHWTHAQQLQSCWAYALYSPANLLLPVAFIPARLILMRFVMRTYLRMVITEGQSPAVAAAATVLSKTTTIPVIVLGILYVIGGVLLVI